MLTELQWNCVVAGAQDRSLFPILEVQTRHATEFACIRSHEDKRERQRVTRQEDIVGTNLLPLGLKQGADVGGLRSGT